jgi:hypothetical protein
VTLSVYRIGNWCACLTIMGTGIPQILSILLHDLDTIITYKIAMYYPSCLQVREAQQPNHFGAWIMKGLIAAIASSLFAAGVSAAARGSTVEGT